jgi:LEA14-like dessication related protein
MREAGSGMRDPTRSPTHPASRNPLPVWVVWCAVVVSGCATVGRLSFHEPDITLTEIHVTGLGLSGGTMDLVFDVFNPNTYRLRSTRVEVGIDLEQRHFGDALLERPLDLSPQNHSQVIVPVRFDWAGLGAGAKALLLRQALDYDVTGRLLVDTPLGERQVALSGRGNVPLRALWKGAASQF